MGKLVAVGTGARSAEESSRSVPRDLPESGDLWLVIVAGLFGGTDATRNFATVITWYLWFFAVSVLTIGVGRAWCMVCPFGALAEWVQRWAVWRRRGRSLGLGRHWPRSLARWGLGPAIAVFGAMTWAEEYFNVAGPGNPRFTSVLVISVLALALLCSLIFERRTFCRYLCPLGVVIGCLGASGVAAGMRARDRQRCLDCATKDCMRGSEGGYGCPCGTNGPPVRART